MTSVFKSNQGKYICLLDEDNWICSSFKKIPDFLPYEVYFLEKDIVLNANIEYIAIYSEPDPNQDPQDVYKLYRSLAPPHNHLAFIMIPDFETFYNYPPIKIRNES